ncbi:hypothetical protein M3600_04060 [Niallia sp. MER 6]|nr:hypothetical protein [Niallia sp. MER 6]
MMKLMFMHATISIPICLYFEKGATGILLSLFFILLAAFFSKPRFNKKGH